MATYTVDTDGLSGTYSSLSAALAALPYPLTDDYTISCDASTAVKDTTSCMGTVIDTTAAYTLTIIGTDEYIYSPAGAVWLEFVHVFGNTYNITIDGLNLEKPSMTVAYQPVLDFSGIRDGEIIVKNCYIYSDPTITLRERLVVVEPGSAYNVTTYFINNVFWQRGSGTSVTCCVAFNTARPSYLYNNTVKGYRFNYVNNANAVFKNNIVDTTIGGYSVSTNSDYNMFSGAFDFGGTNDEQSQTFTFTDATNGDFHLESGDTGARGKGTDLSADGNFPFDYDQDGVTRSAWDAGAFEFVSGGTTHQLSGSLNSASQLTGLLNLTQRLSGTLNSSSNTSGVLRLIQRLSGSLNSSSIVSGTLRLIHGFSGAINSISALLGNLRLIQRLSGTIESHSHLSGNLRIPGIQSLSGSLNSSSSLSGNLTIVGAVELDYPLSYTMQNLNSRGILTINELHGTIKNLDPRGGIV